MISSGVGIGAAESPAHNSLGKSDVMELRAKFTVGGSNRASWDFPISQDLSQMSCLRIRLRCANLAIARQLNVYVHCGSTWYAAEFAPYANGEWDEIVIPKTAFMPEGEASSWKRVDKLRIAAWNGGTGTFVMQVAQIEFLRGNMNVCLLRDCSKVERRAAASAYARNLGNCLFDNGMYPEVIDFQDCTATILSKYSLVLVPYAENLPPGGEKILAAYLGNGGHVFAFHSMPKLLRELLKMPAGKYGSSATHGVSVAGVKTLGGQEFRQQSSAFIAVPPSEEATPVAYWQGGDGKTTKFPAILRSSRGLWMTHVFLNQDSAGAFPVFAGLIDGFLPGAGSNAVRTRLAQTKFIVGNSKSAGAVGARDEWQNAFAAAKSGDMRQAIRRIDAALEKLLDRGGKAPVATSKEMRGVWMRNWQGCMNGSWSGTVKSLAASGVNAIFPYMLSAYDAAFPSNLVAERGNGDKLKECEIASRENHVRLHVWMHCLNCEGAPQSLKERYSREKRFQIGADGKEIQWLCPSQNKNRVLLENIVMEAVRKYKLDGIHLDMIRYPLQQSCYCSACYRNFLRMTGRSAVNWPQDVKPGGKEYDNWQLYRKKVITSLVDSLSRAAKRIRPSIRVSAAVMPDVASSIKNYGQDWTGWLKAGTVDFVCPMDYRMSSDQFAADISHQVSAAGTKDGIVPGIGLTKNRLSDAELLLQIQAVRRAGLPGFVIFECNGQKLPPLK